MAKDADGNEIPEPGSKPNGDTTDVDKLNERITALETENKTLAAANKKFTDQEGVLAGKDNQIATLTSDLAASKTAQETAEAAHKSEIENHGKTQTKLLDTRRANIAIKHGVPAEKLKDMTEAQLVAVEATAPIVGLNGKGLDLGGGGGGRDASELTPMENARSILQKAKDRAVPST